MRPCPRISAGGLLVRGFLRAGANRLTMPVVMLISAALCVGGDLEVIKSFGFPDPGGTQPFGRLLLATDGLLYGTTYSGGVSNVGTVYRLETNGASFQVIHSFGGPPADGNAPTAGVTEGSDGLLYGTTTQGGSYSNGTVYRLEKNGNNYAVLVNFKGTNESYPASELIEASDGALYGTCRGNDPEGKGIIFKVNRDGTGYTNLYTFTGAPDGQYPYAGVIESTNGVLYGTTYMGGVSNVGTVFQIKRDGADYAVLHSFGTLTPTGRFPAGSLLEADDGRLYGTLLGGVPTGSDGALYGLNTNGGEVAIRYTGDGGALRNPVGTLVQASDGRFYAAAAGFTGSSSGIIYQFPFTNIPPVGFIPAFQTVLSLNSAVGPYRPETGLCLGPKDELFGVLSYGGPGDAGAVFVRYPSGTYSNLHVFGTMTDGHKPNGVLIQSSGGKILGATQSGAPGIFSVDADGTDYTNLHRWGSTPGDGGTPARGLTLGSDGMIYGWTRSGGSNGTGNFFRLDEAGANYSILRQIDEDGASTPGGSVEWPLIEHQPGTLVGFRRSQAFRAMIFVSSDGSESSSNLLAGVSGLLYPMLARNHDYYVAEQVGSGRVFRVSANGFAVNNLVVFTTDPVARGSAPRAPVIESLDGHVYGTTSRGGAFSNGTIFRIEPTTRSFAVLLHCTEPLGESGLTEATDGKLYGVVRTGIFSLSVYRINRNGGDLTLVATLPNARNNRPSASGLTTIIPEGRLLETREGELIGTHDAGGTMNRGIVYRMNLVALPAFVAEPQTSIGPLAAPLELTGGVPGGMDRTYQWFFNDTLLAGATNKSLVLPGNTPANAGAYQLVVSTANGSATSSVATITYQDFQWIAGQPWLTLHGPVGANYQLDYRDSLTNEWQFWTNLTLTTGFAQVSDPAATGLTQRVYRSLILP